MNCLLHVTSRVVNGPAVNDMEDEHDFGDMQVVEDARPIPARGRPRCSAGGEAKTKVVVCFIVTQNLVWSNLLVT